MFDSLRMLAVHSCCSGIGLRIMPRLRPKKRLTANVEPSLSIAALLAVVQK